MRFHRRRKGSAIIETGPMLYVFFILIFFPLMDILAMGCQFGCAWYCNFLTCRELAVSQSGMSPATPNSSFTNSTAPNWQTVITYEQANFLHSGIGAFLKVQNISQTATNIPPAAAGLQPTVVLQTVVTGLPFIYVPLPFSAPGLNASIPWTISSERPRDETR